MSCEVAPGGNPEGTRVSREGQGETAFADGSRYAGEWEADRPHGEGTFHYADGGGMYAGQWARGLREGRGTMRRPTLAGSGAP